MGSWWESRVFIRGGIDPAYSINVMEVEAK